GYIALLLLLLTVNLDMTQLTLMAAVIAAVFTLLSWIAYGQLLLKAVALGRRNSSCRCSRRRHWGEAIFSTPRATRRRSPLSTLFPTGPCLRRLFTARPVRVNPTLWPHGRKRLVPGSCVRRI